MILHATHTVLEPTPLLAEQKKFYIESYGCQMNVNDSEIVASILKEQHFLHTQNYEDANLILLNTCSIREKAETTIRNRLKQFNALKKQHPDLLIGILGCMAERLKGTLLEQEKLVDLVVGPDAYKSLPQLIATATEHGKAINVLLSREETYSDISPIRLNSNGVTAFVSIMRGCNNMCSFCVVPFTRGRERSRPLASILKECADLVQEGYREITLLGQNVDSYFDADTKTNFAQLLHQVALINPLLRLRFSTSHPKDITEEVLHVMQQHDNICKYIHLPVQSGSSRILDMMNRTYDREWYIAKVNTIKKIMPNCALSTDMIIGFCSETDEDFDASMSIMEYCKYDLAYMYAYSERPGTLAARQYADDVPEPIKQERLQKIIALHRQHSLERMQEQVGKTFSVLIEGDSKKNHAEWQGRNEHNKVIVFPKSHYQLQKGDYAMVQVHACTSGTLIGTIAINP